MVLCMCVRLCVCVCTLSPLPFIYFKSTDAKVGTRPAAAFSWSLCLMSIRYDLQMTGSSELSTACAADVPRGDLLYPLPVPQERQ